MKQFQSEMLKKADESDFEEYISSLKYNGNDNRSLARNPSTPKRVLVRIAKGFPFDEGEVHAAEESLFLRKNREAITKKEIHIAARIAMHSLPDKMEWAAQQRSIKDERDPKLENIIMKDPEWAYYYSDRLLHGRWKKAEEYIIQDPLYAALYAREHDFRWVEAEPIIARNTEASLIYALSIMRKNRWPEGEAAIAKDKEAASEYANYHGLTKKDLRKSIGQPYVQILNYREIDKKIEEAKTACKTANEVANAAWIPYDIKRKTFCKAKTTLQLAQKEFIKSPSTQNTTILHQALINVETTNTELIKEGKKLHKLREAHTLTLEELEETKKAMRAMRNKYDLRSSEMKRKQCAACINPPTLGGSARCANCLP